MRIIEKIKLVISISLCVLLLGFVGGVKERKAGQY